MTNKTGSPDQSDSEAIVVEIPRLDLVGEIGDACIVKLGSKDGETAWKLRKEVSSLVELLRALKERGFLIHKAI